MNFREAIARAVTGLGVALDAALAPLAPGLARRRMENRLRFAVALATYDFARKDRTTADWKAPRKSADQAILADLAVATPRARQIARDTWVGRSAIGAYLRHVVGSGISLRSAARDPASARRRPEGEWAEFAREVNRLWRRWASDRRLVDLEQKRTLLGLERWAVREYVTTGEAFLVVSYRRRPDLPDIRQAGAVGLVLQAVEQEQLAADLARDDETGNEIRGGIEVDGDGAAVAYHIHIGGHPLEGGGTRIERVPAERVLAFWEPERARQTHGITRFHAVGTKTRHVSMYDEYEVVAKRAEACIAAVRKRGTDSGWTGLAHPAGDAGKDAGGNPVTELAPGMILDVGPDGGIDLLNPQRPGALYEPFMRMQLAEIAAGLDLDEAMLRRDYSRSTYSGQRQGLLEFWTVADTEQELLVDLWLRDIWQAFVRLAIAEGRVRPPRAYWTSAEAAAACLDLDWQGPPRYWIDPAKQGAALKLLLSLRLTTLSRELERLGYTFEDTIDEIAEEEAYAAERGVELPAPDAGQSPWEPRPGSEAGGDHADRVPEAQRRGGRPACPTAGGRGGNGDRILAAILDGALRDS